MTSKTNLTYMKIKYDSIIYKVGMNIYIYPHIRIIAYGAKRMGKGNEDKRQ